MFSIVTATFNVMPFVKRCVGSMRAQAGVDYEHLIQDGGSNDGTREWFETVEDVDFVSEPDRGMYDALNKGFARARGDIIAWLNADEQYLPGTLARVQDIFDAHPDADLVSGHALVVDEEGNPLAARRDLPLRARMIAHTFLNRPSCAMFFRASLRDRSLLRFDPSYKSAGDREMIIRMLEAGVRCVYVDEFLSLFGARDGNISANRTLSDEEARRIRQQFGFRESCLIQRLWQKRRWAERLVRGHYKPVDVAYAFALDEKPAVRHVQAKRVPARFDIKQYAHSGRT